MKPIAYKVFLEKSACDLAYRVPRLIGDYERSLVGRTRNLRLFGRF